MSRRIEVELTSARDDGSWTWRAAGARQPKGVVDAALVPDGAKVGDVLRAEADFDVEGVTLVSLAPATAKKRNEAERIEIIGNPRNDEPLVTSTLVPKGRGDRDRGDRGPRRDRGDRPDRGNRPPGERRGPREGGERRGPRPDGERRPAPAGESRERRPRPARPETPPKPKPKRLRAQKVHRNALMEELPPEHRPIAEQVLQGDIPAVRAAIDKENAGRAERGETAIDGTALIAIAESLRPRLRTAEWRDKAEAALADVDELDLRDLRSVVVAGDAAARDEETRALAGQLRDGLARRVEAEQAAWVAELSEALDDGRVVRALRLSSRPPKAGALLRPDLATKLSEAASAALTELAAPDRWAVLLDAIAHSPVRLTVKPVSLPKAPSDELMAAVRKLASRIPDIAALFGVEPTAAAARGPRRPPKPPRVPKPPAAAKSAAPADAPAAEGTASEAPAPVADAAPETPVAEAAAEAAPAEVATGEVAPADAAPVEAAPVAVDSPAAAPVEPEPATPAPEAASGEQVEDVERVVEDDVVDLGDSAGVPAGEGEAAPDGDGAVPVVAGVADEEHVAPSDTE